MIKMIFGIIFLIISVVLICIVISMISLPFGLCVGAVAFFLFGCLLLSLWNDERES